MSIRKIRLQLTKAIEICKAEKLNKMQFKTMQGQNNINVHTAKKEDKSKRLNERFKQSKKKKGYLKIKRNLAE